MHHKGRPQSMSFPPNYHSLELAGKLKGIKRVLKESVLKERVLKERALKERALKERVLKERVLKERVLKERALKERVLKERALKERVLKELVLKERGLWPERGLMLECPTTHNRPGCDSEGGCCARRVLEAERDF